MSGSIRSRDDTGSRYLKNDMKTNDMDIKEILKAVESGAMSADEAVTRLKLKPYEDIGYAKVDLHRKLRQGVAEVIYGESKTAEQIEGIIRSMAGAGQSCILITRLDAAKSAGVAAATGDLGLKYVYHEKARIAVMGDAPEPSGLSS